MPLKVFIFLVGLKVFFFEVQVFCFVLVESKLEFLFGSFFILFTEHLYPGLNFKPVFLFIITNVWLLFVFLFRFLLFVFLEEVLIIFLFRFQKVVFLIFDVHFSNVLLFGFLFTFKSEFLFGFVASQLQFGFLLKKFLFEKLKMFLWEFGFLLI